MQLASHGKVGRRHDRLIFIPGTGAMPINAAANFYNKEKNETEFSTVEVCIFGLRIQLAYF